MFASDLLDRYDTVTVEAFSEWFHLDLSRVGAVDTSFKVTKPTRDKGRVPGCQLCRVATPRLCVCAAVA